jgi:hypothetical protein
MNATELDNAAIRDLETDAVQAEEQAASGPYYPERGITAASLLAYAAKCRAEIAKYRDSGAHKAALAPPL